MTFFVCTNDVLREDADGNPTWTDEPAWLKKEIDTWQAGGRMWCTPDARHSIIISPDPDLWDRAHGDLVEIDEASFRVYAMMAFPERVNENGETIPTPSTARLCSIYWGHAMNHTGTISANESWAVAGNDHHITGNITIAADVVVTWDAGIVVYVDGNYSVTLAAGVGGITTLTATGTAALPIVLESNATRTGTGVTSGWGGFATLPNNSALTLQYARVNGAGTLFAYNNPTSATLTADHLLVRDLGAIMLSAGAAYNGNLAFSNIRVMRQTSASFGVLHFAAGTATGAVTLTDCMLDMCALVVTGATAGAHTLAFTDCSFRDSAFSSTSMPNFNYTFTRCLFQNVATITTAATATNAVTLASCILGRRNSTGMGTTSGSASTVALTNCDLQGCSVATGYAISNASSAGTVTATSCYVAGWRTADYANYYTGSETPAQVNGTVTFVTGRTAPNFSFAPSSVAVSSITRTGATVAWSAGFRTRNRVRYGTATGVYGMSIEPKAGWSNYDGLGQQTASPSIVLVNLTAGTAYFYAVESYDPIYDQWVTSAEGTFSTLANPTGRVSVM